MEYCMNATHDTDIASTFEDEELVWPDINPDWDVKTLLSQYGMFKFSKIKKILKLETIELTKLNKRCKGEGVNCYRAYGFAKPRGSQYVVRMSVFRHTYEKLVTDRVNITKLKQVTILDIPEHIKNANQLVELEGCFRFGDICQFSPFKEHNEVIKNHIRRVGSQQESMEELGAWFDRSRREYFVRMEIFHKWFLQSIWMHPENHLNAQKGGS